MKRVFVYIFAVCLSSLMAYSSPSDSIIAVCNAMNDGYVSKVNYLRSMFQYNIGQQWAVRLLDSAMDISHDNKYTLGQLYVEYDYYRHYRHMRDTVNMRKSFINIRRLSHQLGRYQFYFRVWSSMLSFRMAKGNSQVVLDELDAMEKEAMEHGYTEGLYFVELERAGVYQFIGKWQESRKLLLNLAERGALPIMEQLAVYKQLANIAMRNDEYTQALKYVDTQKSILDTYIKSNPRYLIYYIEQYLDIELNYCEIYLAIPDKDKLGTHIAYACKYLRPGTMFSFRERYHVMAGGYYYLTSSWQKCFSHFDSAMNSIGLLQPYYRFSVQMLKAQAMEDGGFLRQAALEYRDAVQKFDSLNHVVQLENEKLYRDNYFIRSSIIQKQAAERHANMVILFTCCIMAIVLFMLVIYSIYVHQKIKSAAFLTHKAWCMATSADKQKESFLHSIVHCIRISLNDVMGFSNILSSNVALTPQEKQQYVSIIKDASANLTALIYDILDLSRLESGNYKFTVGRCDLVELCAQEKQVCDFKYSGQVNVTFTTSQSSVYVESDSARFSKMLSSLLSPFGDTSSQVQNVVITLSSVQNDAILRISGSPLLAAAKDTIDDELECINLHHKINTLFVEHFGGHYSIQYEDGAMVVVVVYPLSPSPSI